MARNRTISPDFWTCEAVIDCTPMTRLLFLGLQNFADDGGVQPLRPRTIRMQVFPGDTLDNDQVRAMIDELAAQGLVRLYEVEGVAYVAIVDWDQLQRVGKRARRRYPSDASTVAGGGAAGEEAARTIANHSNVASGIGEASEEPSPTMAKAIIYLTDRPATHRFGGSKGRRHDRRSHQADFHQRGRRPGAP